MTRRSRNGSPKRSRSSTRPGAPSAGGWKASCAMAKTRTSRPASTSPASQAPGVATARQLQGKQLSYNNINDTDAAFELVGEFDPATFAAGRHHQARQSLRCRRRRDARRGLPQGARLRSGLRLRRHRRGQPPARRRGGGGDRQDLHRGDHRARGKRRRRETSSRPRRISRLLVTGGLPDPAAAGTLGQVGRGRPARAVARQCGSRGAGPEGGDEARAERGGIRRPAFRLPRRQAREIQRHRLCQGRRDRRHRRRPDEPGRLLAHCRAQGVRRGRGRRPRRAVDQRLGRSPPTPSSPLPTGCLRPSRPAQRR